MAEALRLVSTSASTVAALRGMEALGPLRAMLMPLPLPMDMLYNLQPSVTLSGTLWSHTHSHLPLVMVTLGGLHRQTYTYRHTYLQPSVTLSGTLWSHTLFGRTMLTVSHRPQQATRANRRLLTRMPPDTEWLMLCVCVCVRVCVCLQARTDKRCPRSACYLTLWRLAPAVAAQALPT